MSIKERIYNLIRDDDENDLASNIFDGVIITLIVINVAIVIAQTFSISETVQRIFNWIELVSVIIFSIEYLLRVYTADLMYPELPRFKARIKYIFSFMAMIDLLAILPFYLPYLVPIDLRVLRVLRVIRLFQIFKLNRYTTALASIGTVFKRKKSQLLSSIFVVLSILWT